MNIAMICDYFYPNKGGIETHIKTISEELIKLGNNVIIITHKYKDHVGCMLIGNVKVYYIDLPILVMNTTFPTIFNNFVVFEHIFRTNSIDIVHGHQSLSNLCLEGIFHGSNLNLKTILTDHSVFEIGKFERIIVDKLTSFLCKKLDFIICVSETARKNTLQRINLPNEKSKVISNGIRTELFYPKTKKTRNRKIRIIFMARLTFRKGIDLLISSIPLIFRNKNLEMQILGDGPKLDEIKQVIFENELQDQISFIQDIEYEEVGAILREGDIFLNTSLTETFCMAILEAAACGLIVVTTNVGGIYEILPHEHMIFVKPTPEDINKQIENAILKLDDYDPEPLSKLIMIKYDWNNIAKDVESVYNSINTKTTGIFFNIDEYKNYSFLSTLGMIYEYIQIYIFRYFNK